ncbi:MAG: TatD family hydrolase, partial [Candidatus Omnitrophota bacterium]
MLIDTHCHLDFKDFDKDRDETLERAKRSGVSRIINVASSIEGTRRCLELAAKYDIVYATAGIHPHEASSVDEAAMAEMKAAASHPKVVAIGEVGLDYYRNLSPKDAQVQAYIKFIRLAVSTGLPIIIHTRNARNEALDILEEESKGGMRGVVHCFSGDMNFLKRALDLGLFISFTANLTYKNAGELREVAKHVPVEKLLLETDAPFLAPQEFRGKRNEPSYLKYLVEEWVRISGLSGGDIERITTHNANKLFKLDIGESSKIVYPIRDSLYLNITNRCTNACT